MRKMLHRAMQQADDLVVKMDYTDSKGQQTIRVVSPIRFLGSGRFLGLCLCRCEPRQFDLQRCQNAELQPAHQYMMPVPLKVVGC